MKSLLIRKLDDELHQRIVIAARKDGRTITEWLKRLLDKATAQYRVKADSTDANIVLDK